MDLCLLPVPLTSDKKEKDLVIFLFYLVLVNLAVMIGWVKLNGFIWFSKEQTSFLEEQQYHYTFYFI